jgi:hypothetical protein
LTASQQRLIYRGRLIGGGGGSGAAGASNEDTESVIPTGNEENTANAVLKQREPKIRDIVGLTDGHTIHLMRKPTQQQQDENEENAAGTSEGASGEHARQTSRSNSGDDSSGSTSLLAALLGMGDEDRPRLRGRRRAHYRLTESDVQVPDPGSMETVRQGLLTLHTLLPTAEQPSSPVQANRQFYRGQWIDCRDTVNQWLEATVVEIVLPDEILPPLEQASGARSSSTRLPTSDPAVGSEDLEGRRRLLLEPAEGGEGEFDGYRRRGNNEGVQLLLVHYNGWPHRWDEWIRSDSERIRPFRVRTRHSTSGQHISPTIQSPLEEAPSTHIASDIDAEDRRALLPELARVVQTVNDLMTEAAARTPPPQQQHPASVSRSSSGELPWIDAGEHPARIAATGSTDAVSGEETVAENNTAASRRQTRRKLETLAPLLDRLGRTLVDAAPHVAAMAASVTERDEEEAAEDPPLEQPTSPLEGLLSLLSRDRRRQSTGTTSSNVAVPSDGHSTVEQTSRSGEEEAEEEIDPDYSDFATGPVNTTRGELRTGPRSLRSIQGDDVAGLLGAYLAAASLGSLVSTSDGGSEDGDDGEENAQGLGRLFRERGNGGGGGIDIHIHAVVTAPIGAMGGGGGGIATMGTAGTTPGGAGISSLFSQSRAERRNSLRFPSPAAPIPQDDDDQGIFSELYSENPNPVDPTSPTNDTPQDELNRSTRSVRSVTSLSPPRRSSRRSESDMGNSRHSSEIRGRRTGGMFGRFFRRNN